MKLNSNYNLKTSNNSILCIVRDFLNTNFQILLCAYPRFIFTLAAEHSSAIDMHPWIFFTAAFYGLVCICFESCMWVQVHAEVLVPVTALCCPTPDLWHSDTFQRRLVSRLHNYIEFQQRTFIRADQCTWLLPVSAAYYISIFPECIYHFNSFHQWLYRRVTYALMRTASIWWIWFCTMTDDDDEDAAGTLLY